MVKAMTFSGIFSKEIFFDICISNAWSLVYSVESALWYIEETVAHTESEKGIVTFENVSTSMISP